MQRLDDVSISQEAPKIANKDQEARSTEHILLQSPQREATLLPARSRTSSRQNCEAMNLCSLSYLVVGIICYGRLSKLIHLLDK